MSKPKYLDSYTRESKTITAIQSDYAIVSPWSDKNPEGEQRLGYFVSISENNTDSGVSIVKATETSKVFGVTTKSPGVATNVDKSICDLSNGLDPSYAYVCFSGFAEVRSDGTIDIGDICKPNHEGIATKSDTGVGYRVVDRRSATYFIIHVDPLLQVDVRDNKLIISY